MKRKTATRDLSGRGAGEMTIEKIFKGTMSVLGWTRLNPWEIPTM